MYRQSSESSTSDEEAMRARRVLEKVRGKGVKVGHMERQLRNQSVGKILAGKMRPPRELYVRILAWGTSYGVNHEET
jgi:hypothetical protein